MKKGISLSLVLLLFVFVSPAQASVIDDIKKSLRPHVVKIFGQETANKILGVDPNAIELPEIPRVVKNARDSHSIGLAARNENKFSEEDNNRYNYFFVKEVVQATQQREATENEVSKWMNVLTQSGSRSGVYRAMVLDSYYMKLENDSYVASTGVINFTLFFIEKFLNKSISKANLESANFYSVKRDIIEKTLEVLEELYKREGNDVYDWYAILSKDLAENYSEAMDNKIRKNIDPIVHRNWALSVPDQYLRSEVFIKLHKVFNRLQVAP